jgi:regulator of replication initiation timing
VSDIKNDSIDKLADEYSNTESDQKAYIKAQSSTIISQTKEINNLKRELEKLAKENERLLFENTQMRATNPEKQFETSDEETICVVQLAILKNYAMSRELTMEETKKVEILNKILLSIRDINRKNIETDNAESLSNEDLLKMMEALNKVAE